MKKFILRLIIISPFITLPFLAYVAVFADGKTDAFYLRFTSGRQSSLIIGTSRAAQGIQPAVLNNSELIFEKPIYNFSFGLGLSSYGPVYLNAIKNKLISASNNALFIVEVNPMSISTLKENKSNDPKKFAEHENVLDKLHFFNTNPNYEYLLTGYAAPFYTIFFKHFRQFKGDAAGKSSESFVANAVKSFIGLDNSILRKNGWLEISVPMDSSTVEKRITKSLTTYENHFKTHRLSSIRLKYLHATIECLLQHGSVYLVRLPVDERMYEMELNYMNDFDLKMSNIAHKYNISYLNFTNDCKSYRTTDGNHLYKESGAFVSEQIIKKINESR